MSSILKRTRSLGHPVSSIRDMYILAVNGKTLGEVELPSGAGAGLAGGQLCVMQLVTSGFMGELTDKTGVSDSPTEACSTLGAFCRTLNDTLGEGPRQRLKEYVPRIAHAPVSAELAAKRGEISNRADWDKIKEQPILGFMLLDEMLTV